MGYFTNHKLNIVTGNDNVTNYEKEISELAQYDDCFNTSIRWYNCENDIKKYSLKHPDTVFEIIGSGQDIEDLWKAYFKNGKMEKIKAVIEIYFEDFNEINLE